MTDESGKFDVRNLRDAIDDDSGAYDARGIRLSDADIERIAKIAARKALVEVYAEVGQSVLKKAAWLIGVALLCLLIYLAGKNALPAPAPHP